ncbi:GNAT family N-acetyltransferase [Aeromicrobium phragmitis]|uniref:GNAT family N-acetyltransferase n=1 Tax=Aeromicrobium phragmitis TaxID=2478914 RepID=A0A3L8PP84_9ACTN|nr:GNAT family N-acetyltransferase [Aeromicrobium phragmitis]RLV57181.1 GNAT family N-acetyltransferase [Aeromicrobium phragmitis]
MVFPIALDDGVVLRVVEPADAAAMAAAAVRNREHLAPYEPERDPSHYTEEGQLDGIETALTAMAQGRRIPLVLAHGDGIIGALNVNDIVRGAFDNGHVGYWTDAGFQGRGLMSAAVEHLAAYARNGLGLHRLQAAALPDNERSQRVLVRAGFERIGYAPEYLKIAGRWQDHILFQRILAG